MPNLSDEPMPLVIDNVPRKRAAQLRIPQRMDGTARSFLRTDVR
jgi:hypothetical protein